MNIKKKKTLFIKSLNKSSLWTNHEFVYEFLNTLKKKRMKKSNFVCIVNLVL